MRSASGATRNPTSFPTVASAWSTAPSSSRPRATGPRRSRTIESACRRLTDPPHPALGLAYYQEAELHRLTGAVRRGRDRVPAGEPPRPSADAGTGAARTRSRRRERGGGDDPPRARGGRQPAGATGVAGRGRRHPARRGRRRRRPRRRRRTRRDRRRLVVGGAPGDGRAGQSALRCWARATRPARSTQLRAAAAAWHRCACHTKARAPRSCSGWRAPRSATGPRPRSSSTAHTTRSPSSARVPISSAWLG